MVNVKVLVLALLPDVGVIVGLHAIFVSTVIYLVLLCLDWNRMNLDQKRTSHTHAKYMLNV